jgi:hypothetical protein
MKYVFYILLLVSIVFGNEELNSYLNNKDLENQIIKDEKNKRIIIDLLDDENKMLIFIKEQKGDYQKLLDEKLYFCNDTNTAFFRSLNSSDNYLIVRCFSNNVDGGQFDMYYYFNSQNILKQITKAYSNDEGIIKSTYQFIPKINIPTLSNYKDKNFSYEYLNQNYKNFIKIVKSNKTIYNLKQPLYSEPQIKTKMYLLKNDKVEILEEKDDWLYILYKGKKDIKAWIPKSAVEYK